MATETETVSPNRYRVEIREGDGWVSFGTPFGEANLKRREEFVAWANDTFGPDTYRVTEV